MHFNPYFENENNNKSMYMQLQFTATSIKCADNVIIILNNISDSPLLCVDGIIFCILLSYLKSLSMQSQL